MTQALADNTLSAAERRGLWFAYAGLSLAWLFNLVTIAGHIDGLWFNLVVPQPVTPVVWGLRAGALLCAAGFLGLFIWLVRRAPLPAEAAP